LNKLILRLVCVFENLAKNDEGQDLVEYALLTSLIALAAIGGVSKVATAVTSIFTKVSTSIT
jgi:Flp pilus assembly pilin Flp